MVRKVNETNCPICCEVMQTRERPDKPIINPACCGQHYHQVCLDGWKRIKQSCPSCRTDFNVTAPNEDAVEDPAFMALGLHHSITVKGRRLPIPIFEFGGIIYYFTKNGRQTKAGNHHLLTYKALRFNELEWDGTDGYNSRSALCTGANCRHIIFLNFHTPRT